MARVFRIWEKKRGDRQTGSKMVGSVGEAIFFGCLFLIGTTSLSWLIAMQVINGEGEPFRGGFIVVILVLSSFVLIGGGGLVLTVVQAGVSIERRSAIAKRAMNIDLVRDQMLPTRLFPFVPSDTNLTNSPGVVLAYRLPSSQSPAWILIASTMFFLFWTAVSSTFTVIAFERWRAGQPEWLLNLSLIPFIGVSVWATYYLWQLLRLHTGIGPTSVEVSDHPLLPGQDYQICLTQTGRLNVDVLEVRLVCEELATYKDGTDVRTETHRVYNQSLMRATEFSIEPGIPFEQEFRLSIPEVGMHSFQGRQNAIHWRIHVHGEADDWPAFYRSFPLVVYPPVSDLAVSS